MDSKGSIKLLLIFLISLLGTGGYYYYTNFPFSKSKIVNIDNEGQVLSASFEFNDTEKNVFNTYENLKEQIIDIPIKKLELATQKFSEIGDIISDTSPSAEILEKTAILGATTIQVVNIDTSAAGDTVKKTTNYDSQILQSPQIKQLNESDNELVKSCIQIIDKYKITSSF